MFVLKAAATLKAEPSECNQWGTEGDDVAAYNGIFEPLEEPKLKSNIGQFYFFGTASQKLYRSR